jgi:tetratricopeptide (TPR) repeat protein/predicted Ser/Thr protein kinase
MNSDRPDKADGTGSGVDDAALIDAARKDAAAARPTEASPGAGGVPTILPDSFAGYQILREIHRGGQGVVYQAIQKSTKRKVALKVMKEGPFATPAEEARFEREVQILGQLNHPNIVAIHDSGQAAGCHYFVMDYISGQPLDVWMASAAHSIEETLKLFAKICTAVNAAHLRGITHRDLKPGNIRIDENGEPHILDFGLAKVAHSAEEASLMTLTGQFMGSLPWASPEQAEGAPSKVDIRTDVYSLGVILYQMLTGRFPYEVIGNMRDVLDRIMRAEPTRPSTIRKRINDEVETIVLKCLAKERERRYQSAGELARDIGHYLAGEPIEAKRDSAAYVLRKYLRKYRLPAAVAAGFVVVVTVGLIGSLTFWRQAVVERGHAEQSRIVAEERRLAAEVSEAKAVAEANEAKKQRDKAERIADFMAQTLSGVGPAVALGRDTTMLREMMDAAAKRIEDGELQAAPEAELRLRLTIGNVYRDLPAYDAAERMLRPAVELARTLHPGDHPAKVASLDNYGRLLEDAGELAAAELPLREALEMSRRLSPGDDSDIAASINNLAVLVHLRGDLVAAEPLAREALEMHRRLHPGDHPDTPAGLMHLGFILQERGELAAAEPLVREALEMDRRLHPGDHPSLAASILNLATLLHRQGDLVDAEPLFQEALAMCRRLYPDGHPYVALSLGNLAALLRDRGDLAAAEALLREALEMNRRLFPGDSHRLAISLNNLAHLLLDRGDLAAAEPLMREALDMCRKVLPPGHWDIGNSANGLGSCLTRMNRFAEAEPALLEANGILRAAQGAPPDRLPENIWNLIRLYDAWDAAEPGQGHDQQAAVWRAKRAEWQASTQPATATTSAPASGATSTPSHSP